MFAYQVVDDAWADSSAAVVILNSENGTCALAVACPKGHVPNNEVTFTGVCIYIYVYRV